MAAARQHLLAVYQRLQQAVAAAQDHADAIPLTTPDQFVQPFLSVTSEISSAVAASKQDLAGDSVLSGALRTDLACQSS